MSYIECPHCWRVQTEYEFKATWKIEELKEHEEKKVKCEYCNKEFFVSPQIVIQYNSRMDGEDYLDAFFRKCDRVVKMKERINKKHGCNLCLKRIES